MALSDLERRNAGGQILSLVPFDLERPNMAGNTCGKERISRVSHAPTARGRCPSAPQFWGFFLFMRTPFVAELPNLTWQHTWGGGGGNVGVSHASHPKRAEFQWSPILVFLPTPFNADRPNSAWWHMWEWRVFRSATLLQFAQMRRAVCQRQLSFLFFFLLLCYFHFVLLNDCINMRLINITYIDYIKGFGSNFMSGRMWYELRAISITSSLYSSPYCIILCGHVTRFYAIRSIVEHLWFIVNDRPTAAIEVGTVTTVTGRPYYKRLTTKQCVLRR